MAKPIQYCKVKKKSNGTYKKFLKRSRPKKKIKHYHPDRANPLPSQRLPFFHPSFNHCPEVHVCPSDIYAFITNIKSIQYKNSYPETIQSVLPLQVLHQWYQIAYNFSPMCVWLGGGGQSPLEIYLYGNIHT